jgi:hypothetical protein
MKPHEWDRYPCCACRAYRTVVLDTLTEDMEIDTCSVASAITYFQAQAQLFWSALAVCRDRHACARKSWMSEDRDPGE